MLIFSSTLCADMTPYYKHVCKTLHLNVDQSLVDQMKAANDAKLKELDEKVANAEKNEGETEIRDSMLAKAHYLSKIGNKVCVIGFFFNDGELVTKNIDKANSLIEEGGDWDRRNRLKVYRGLHSLSVRDFDSAAKHFLDAVATFTSYELMDYKSFIIYTVLTAMIALKRQDLRTKVISGSEVQEVLHSLPAVKEYLDSLFECRYADFFLYLGKSFNELCYRAQLLTMLTSYSLTDSCFVII
ncbi:unnamed protein product [Dibothriocephalus latus]|uniref:26S proteasome regulatory subunit Rpn7 N-terminal domain-containing protein n=1 Tax=Dibothriocephalus latus TaxID=60516 RepID=A0A3P7LQ17_DIBLA|nr:unnamed protein product [Dibothriocephalus latus]